MINQLINKRILGVSDMNYYEKNMECIKTSRKHLYRLMKDADIQSLSNNLDEIYSINAKDGQQVLIVKSNNIEYRLNSAYNPVEEAKRWATQFKFHNINNIVSMFGFGNGVFARVLYQNMGEQDILLIYEPSIEIFLHILYNYDITDILTNNKIVIAIENINGSDFRTVLQNFMNITNMSEQVMCVYPQYDKLFPESCLLFWKELKDSYLYTKVNINTEIVFGKKIIENVLYNIRFISNSNTLLELKNMMPKDTPAIVVAAGPSVGKQIEELKRAKGKAVIFAVDRIVDYLLDSGLEPDFIVTIDPIKPVRYFSRRTDIMIPLICFMNSNPEILEAHKGRKIFCRCNPFLDKVYTDAKKVPPEINSGTSVATTAFSACIELGFEKIILVGQDLAYDGDKTHAGESDIKQTTGRDVMVEDINGRQIRSRYDWKRFITWYQDMLTIYTEIIVIDAKEKGAKIKGTTVMSLKEALDKNCSREYGENIVCDDLETTFNSVEINSIKEYLVKNLVILSNMKSKSKQAIKLCEILIKEVDSKKSTIKGEESLKKIGRINRYLAKQPIYGLMGCFITGLTAQDLKGMFQFTDDISGDSRKIYEKSKNVFMAIIVAADYIRPLVEKAIENINVEQDIK